jgi:hypothetical protein
MAGCSTDTVCASVGLELADLFPSPPEPKGHRRQVARYRYEDEQGQHLSARAELVGMSAAPLPGSAWVGRRSRSDLLQFRSERISVLLALDDPDGSAGLDDSHHVWHPVEHQAEVLHHPGATPTGSQVLG